MAKLRHIAILFADADPSASFFERALDSVRVADACVG
jgi:hypothetical protein